MSCHAQLAQIERGMPGGIVRGEGNVLGTFGGGNVLRGIVRRISGSPCSIASLYMQRL